MILYSDNILDFSNYIKQGKICLFETDTVVGIGIGLYKLKDNKYILNFASLDKIYKIKNRSIDKKLPWLISSYNMCQYYCKNISNKNKNLIEKESPGNTTFVLNVNKDIDNKLCVSKKTENSTKKSIAFRIPAKQNLLMCIEILGFPILCTSANISGQKCVSNIKDVNQQILDKVDYVFIDKSKKTYKAKASRIIDCTDNKYKIIRN